MQTEQEQGSGEQVHIWTYTRQRFMKLHFSSGTKRSSADTHGSYCLYNKGSMLIGLNYKHTDLRDTGNSSFVKIHHRTNSQVYHRNEMGLMMSRN